MNNAIIKELLKETKGQAFRAANHVYNMDFTKDFIIEKIEGKFTHNSIEKMLNINIYNYNIVLFIKDAACYRKDYVYMVDMNAHSFNNELAQKIYNYRPIDNFYRKTDIEETRKKETTITYIIAQTKTLENPGRPAENNKRERLIFNYSSMNIAHYTTKDTGKEVKFYSRGKSPEIDKSGYYLTEKRETLKNKAYNLRTERARQAVENIDFTSNMEQIKIHFNNLKNAIIESLRTATDPQEISTISKALRELEWEMNSIKGLEEATKNKTFSSPEKAYCSFNRTTTKLLEIQATL